MNKRILAAFLAATLCVTVFAGCTKNNNNADFTDKYGKGEIAYPLQTEGETIEMFMPLSANISKMGKTVGDLQFRKELAKRTGINVEYVTPTSAQWTEQFNLLFSSNDLPDIIYYNWREYAGGGADGAIDNGYITDLTPYLPDYAPNYWKMLNDNETALRAARSPKGRFSNFGGFDHGVPCYGAYLRADWLKELGLEVPETIAEWENVLTAFRDKKGADRALAFGWSKFYTMGVFETAFETSSGMYVDDNGKINYGPATENWLAYMNQMKDWVNKGLLDKEVATTENDALNSYILTDETGASIGWIGSDVGGKINAKPAGSSFDLVGAPYPVINKGDTPKRYGGTKSVISDSYAIAGNSPNKELAMRFLDYGYSPEGDLFFNYGTEGLSYEMVDGKPKYTDLIMNNPDGLSIVDATTEYAHNGGGAYAMHADTYLAQIVMPQQLACAEIWATDDSHMLPAIALTTEEKKEIANILSSIETYVGEVTLGYISGTVDEATAKALPSKLKEMGVDRAIDIYQKALDRFNK